jgi:hypothetical protein
MSADDEMKNLEDEANWDWSKFEGRSGGTARRTVASVSFRKPDFQTVARAAHRMGMKTSEFIRSAAMQAAQSRGREGQVFGVSTNSAVIFNIRLVQRTEGFRSRRTSLRSTEPEQQPLTY